MDHAGPAVGSDVGAATDALSAELPPVQHAVFQLRSAVYGLSGAALSGRWVSAGRRYLCTRLRPGVWVLLEQLSDVRAGLFGLQRPGADGHARHPALLAE